MKSLTAKQQIIQDHLDHGLSAYEIAARTGRHVSTIQKQIARICKKKRKPLFDYMDRVSTNSPEHNSG